jgi:hypothetical protein
MDIKLNLRQVFLEANWFFGATSDQYKPHNKQGVLTP